MKSPQQHSRRGAFTPRSPPTQDAEVPEATLLKNTAETVAEKGCQWSVVGESKAYSPCGAPWSLFCRLTSCRWSEVRLRVCPVATVCYGRCHMRVSAVALQHRLTAIERLATSPITRPPARPARLCAIHTPLFILWRITSQLSVGVAVPFRPLWLVVVLQMEPPMPAAPEKPTAQLGRSSPACSERSHTATTAVGSGAEPQSAAAPVHARAMPLLIPLCCCRRLCAAVEVRQQRQGRAQCRSVYRPTMPKCRPRPVLTQPPPNETPVPRSRLPSGCTDTHQHRVAPGCL